MAKTVKIGDEYYSEGVRVPAPKKATPKKVVAKKPAKKKDSLSKMWAGEKARRKAWSK